MGNCHLSFEDALGRVQPVTVLAGPNGCGKTSILFAVIQALRGELPFYTVNTEVKTKWMKKWGKKEIGGAQ